MEVFYNIDSLPAIENSITTIGFFDGVHLGHQKVLKQVVETAQQQNFKSVLLTFWPHPKSVINENEPFLLLNSIEEKLALFSKTQIDYVLVLPFTKEFSQLSAQNFISEYVIKALKTKKLVIGYDHRFGKDKEGGFDYLFAHQNEFGLEVVEILREDVDNMAVSSTRIRESILAGDVDLAAQLLGYHYTISGTVVHGNKLGRTIGFPTANVDVPFLQKLLPKNGVYAVKVLIDNQWLKAMLNIGYKPTVGSTKLTIEANIFDFDADIYNQNITIQFIARLRDEQKFNGLEALVNQLNNDFLQASEVLKTF